MLSYFLPSISDLLVLTLSYFLSIIQAHLTQRKFVWNSNGKYLPELFRFSAAYVTQYSVNIILLTWSGNIFEFNREARQGVIIVLLTLVMYAVNRRGVFRVSD